jgi:hypothetical protein
LFYIVLFLSTIFQVQSSYAVSDGWRETINFNSEWTFHLGEDIQSSFLSIDTAGGFLCVTLGVFAHY